MACVLGVQLRRNVVPQVSVLPDSPKLARPRERSGFDATLHLSLILEEEEDEQEEEAASHDAVSSPCVIRQPRIIISEFCEDEMSEVASIFDLDASSELPSLFDFENDRAGGWEGAKIRGPAPESMHPPAFTTNPDDLEGRAMRTTLVKSPRGLGFTIVGSGGETTSGQTTPTDSPRSQPGGRTLLQIRSITPGGPAAVDGVLTPGDVLVYVDATCVLGHTHGDVVKLFQGIAVGATVTLSVSRGYALPALDSDTQVITTSAVGPDSPGDFLPNDGLAVEFVRVHLLKAATGFGFTVADCDQGQRIKQIVDQSRCRLLREGDILVEVDDKRVKEMSHLAVVQLLKECPVGQVTRILVQRQRPPTGPRPRPISTSSVDPELRKPPIASAPQPERSSLIRVDANGHATNGRAKPDFHKSVTIITPPSSTSHHAATVLRPSQCPVPLPKSPSEPLPSKPTIRRLPATSVSECMGRPKAGQVVRGPSLTIKPSKSFDNSAPPPKSPFSGLAASRRLLSGSSHQLFSALRQRTRTPERPRPASMLVEEQKAPAALAETDDGEETTTTEDGEAEAEAEARDLRFRMLRGPNGFGFRLVGGAEEGTAITVGSIVQGGAAEKDGRLLCGDEILAVDNVSVIGASHHRAVQLMDGRSQIILTVRRWSNSPSTRLRRASLPANPVGRERARVDPVDVQLRRHPGASGFGFSLIPSTAPHNPGALIEIIEMIQPMSAADLCGRMRPGDRLVAVNGADVSGLQHKEVIARIERAGRDLQLRLLPALRANSSSSSMTNGSHSSSNNNNNNEDFYEKRSMTLGRSKSSDRSGGGVGGQLRLCVSTPKIERRASSPERSPGGNEAGGGGAMEVFLRRGPRGFGFSIRGGWEFNRMPLFILRIAEAGAAREDGRMKVGDRILSINGRSTNGMTHAEAVALIQAQRASIRLRLVRDVPDAS